MPDHRAGPQAQAGENVPDHRAGPRNPAGDDGRDHRAGLRARIEEIGGEGAGRALMARLLRSYVAKTPAGIETLAERWGAGDADGVRDQAHALKGSATNVGVLAMGELCGEIEDAARGGRLPDRVEGLARVAATFAEVAPICTRFADELD